MTLMAKNSIINDEKFIPHSISKAIYDRFAKIISSYLHISFKA